MKLTECPRLRGAVETKLELWRSPSQISRWLIRTYRDDEEMRVSHETIYQPLFVQGKGALRKELMAISAHGEGYPSASRQTGIDERQDP
jgi:IS30 family transposase